MAEIIAFSSPKGGSGATFVCAGVFCTLEKMKKNVLAVDLRGENGTLDFALSLQDCSVFDISDVISGRCTADDAVCMFNDSENASFIRAANSDFSVDIGALSEFLTTCDNDFVLLDVSGSDIVEIAPLCTRVITVTDNTEICARMCERAVSDLENDKSRVVINKIIPEYIENGIFSTVDDIVDLVGVAPIGLIPWFAKASAYLQSGIGKVLADKKMCAVFDNISRRLLGESVPAVDFDIYYDCFKVKRRR